MNRATKIYLWCPRPDNFLSIGKFGKVLSGFEAKQIESFKSETRKSEFAAGRFLLRTILAQEGFAMPESFTSAEGKKPFAPGLPQFNISHSKDMLAVAIGAETPLGLDIELSSSERDVLSLVGKYGTPAELAMLSSLDAKERGEVFNKIWSLKEAYVKATGWGVGKYMQKLSFDYDKMKILEIPGEEPCVFYYLKFKNSHVSLCELQGRTQVPQIFVVELSGDSLKFQEFQAAWECFLVGRPSAIQSQDRHLKT